MENSLKQRIIGAVVLAALAIIFLPAILKEKTSNGTFESQIPDKPEALKTYRVDTQKVDSLIKESDLKRAAIEKQHEESISEASDPDLTNSELNSPELNNKEAPSKTNAQTDEAELEEHKKKEIAETLTKPKSPSNSENNKTTIGDKFTDAAWVVQVASFSNESNAIKMVDRLKKANYKAYRRKVTANKRVVFRVFVGPYIEKHKAKASLVEISKLSQSDAVIRPFDPIKH